MKEELLNCIYHEISGKGMKYDEPMFYSVASHKTRFHHLHGEEFITEQVLHCKFK